MFLFAVTPICIQEVYNRDRSPEVDDVEGLAAAATKHLELLKQKDEAESSRHTTPPYWVPLQQHKLTQKLSSCLLQCAYILSVKRIREQSP